MKLTGSIEENVLTLLVHSDRQSAALVMRLQPDIFSTRNYRKIAEKAYEHIERYSQPPKAHIYDLLEADLRKGDEGKLLLRALQAMTELAKTIQEDFVLGKLDEFIQHRTIKMALENADEALERGEISKAREALYIPELGGKPNAPGIWLHDAEAMLRFLDKREEDTFLTGIEVLDARGVSPERGTQMVFIAPAKRGKSWFCLNLAITNIMRGKSVLHITLENSEKLSAERYTQALFALTSKQTKQIKTVRFVKNEIGQHTDWENFTREAQSLTDVPRAKLAKQLKAMSTRGRLLIKEFPTSSLTIPQYNAYLDYLERVEGFVPDIVIVDYPDLMRIDTGNLRIETGAIFRQLRGVAVTRKHALITPTQGNRTSSTAKIVGSNMVAEDFSKIGTADTVLCYSQTAMEADIGLARILVANARSTEDKWIAMISQNYATGQFCLDSVYMNRQLEAEIDKFMGGDGNGDAGS